MRVVAVMLLLSAGIAAEAVSYSFVCKASGRLGGPIRFEFYRDSTTRPKTDIESFTVSMRTADDRWKAMWSILSGRGLTQPIEYGVTPPGFTTMIQPQKLIPGRGVNRDDANAASGKVSAFRFVWVLGQRCGDCHGLGNRERHRNRCRNAGHLGMHRTPQPSPLF